MYLSEVDIGADHEIVERYQGGFVQKFSRDHCCITEPYRALISRRVQTQSTRKINLTFTDTMKSPPPFSPGVCAYRWPFDFSQYVPAATRAKKEQILTTLTQAMLWLASHEDWDPLPFQEAHDQIVARDYECDGLSKRSWASPNGKFRVRIYLNLELEAVELCAVLYENRSPREIGRVPLGTGLPFLGCFKAYASHGKWQSDCCFQLQSDASTYWTHEWQADFSAFM